MGTTSSGAAFIGQLSRDALASGAVDHPYLRAFVRGDFADPPRAFRDFATQYGFYSSQFTSYLEASLNLLHDPAHRAIFESNLSEEHGDAHDFELPPEVEQSVAGQSHAELFRLFQTALNACNQTTPAPDEPGQIWSSDFRTLCAANEFVCVGAIGIGTELLVAEIYAQILQGLRAHTQLTLTQRIFFELHCTCDEEHAAQMQQVAAELACDSQACAQIEHGVQEAIRLRTRFWDSMLERARRFPAPSGDDIEAFSDLGYQTSL